MLRVCTCMHVPALKPDPNPTCCLLSRRVSAATVAYQVQLGAAFAVVPSMPPHTIHTLILPPPAASE